MSSMDSREVCVWLDKRWYGALSSQLKKEGATVEEKLDEYLNAMIGQLPEQVREKISREIGRRNSGSGRRLRPPASWRCSMCGRMAGMGIFRSTTLWTA